MMQSETPPPDQVDHVPPGSRTTPWDLTGPAPLWKPRHPSASMREMASLPILFWLVAELRPALTVQIGLGHGTSFLGLCQATEKAETGGTLLAQPLGKEALTLDQAEQHGALYSQIAQIGVPDNLPEDLADRPLQLLVLHRPLDDNLRDIWLPRLAENAVILTHFSTSLPGEAQMAALLEALPQPIHRVGLRCEGESIDMLLIGESLPERVLHLAGNSQEAKAARALFQRLADGMRQQALARKRLDALSTTTASLKEAEARLEDLQKEAEAAQQAEAREVAKAAALQAQIFDLTQRVTAAESVMAELEELRKAMCQVETALRARDDQVSARETALARMAEDLETTRMAHAEAEALAIMRQSELHVLTKEVQKLEAAKQAENAATRNAESRIKEAQKLVASKQAENDALRASTSWRITAPIRKVKDGWLRLRRS